MRISLNWLQDYVDLSGLSPQQLAEALTNAGLEVEHIETIGPVFTNVVVGKVLSVQPHPNADKLRLVTVNYSKALDTAAETHDTVVCNPATVVCGAPNVKEGLLIAFALSGATVKNRKDGSLFTLGEAVIRGVPSSGMICSIDELGLENQYPKTEDGIWPLNTILSEAAIGKPLAEALELSSDVVLETAPTANRGDLMSYVGVAREVAALFNRPLNLPEASSQASFELENLDKIAVEITLPDASVCLGYSGALLEHIETKPAPDWMTRRLEAAGMRSISNVVDITNYVMLETGQPLHAFDADRLDISATDKKTPAEKAAGVFIGVRRAKPGETLTTLDGQIRNLTEAAVVITQNDTPVALAGVMGGESTEVSQKTQRLFLEAAVFPAETTRRSARSVGLRSEASARFERGIDPQRYSAALARAIQLLKTHATAQLAGIAQSPVPAHAQQTLPFRLSRFERLTGLSLPAPEAKTILEKLGFQVQTSSEKLLAISVPSFRQQDVTREADLIEEVLRIKGLEAVPYTLPSLINHTLINHTPYSADKQRFLERLHQLLSGSGFQEVMTNSLIGSGLLAKTGFTPDAKALVSVSNSHSQEHTQLRQSLLPTLLEVLKHNVSQGLEAMWLYEIGRTYWLRAPVGHKTSGVIEKLMLGGVLLGLPHQGGWLLPKSQKTEAPDGFYHAKGQLEGLLDGLGFSMAAVTFLPAEAQNSETQNSHLHPGKTARLVYQKKALGWLGQLHPQRQAALKLRQPVYAFELDIEAMFKALQHQQEPKAFAENFSAYPAVERDMAFVVPVAVSHQHILDTLKAVSDQQTQALLKTVTLFDCYEGEPIEPGYRSLAYRLTLQSETATLTDEQIEASMAHIKTHLSGKLPVQFRGPS